MRIVFFGTPEFAVESLQAIIDEGHEVVAVVTAPDRPGGRGNKLIESDVKKFAMENGLPILQPEKLRDETFLSTLKSLDADVFVVIAFRMLPELVWGIPPKGTFNLHASLLPQLRGAAPINHAIIQGFKNTGVTTFFINSEIDKGEILLSSSVPIDDDDDAGTLHDKLKERGAKVVIETLKGIEDGSLTPTPQPQADFFTPAPKIFKPDCKIDFSKTAREVERMVRGLSPYPGAWSYLRLKDGKEIEVKILKCTPLFENREKEPGSCEIVSKALTAATGDGGAIRIDTIQPAGKKPMDGRAFLAGYAPQLFF